MMRFVQGDGLMECLHREVVETRPSGSPASEPPDQPEGLNFFIKGNPAHYKTDPVMRDRSVFFQSS